MVNAYFQIHVTTSLLDLISGYSRNTFDFFFFKYGPIYDKPICTTRQNPQIRSHHRISNPLAHTVESKAKHSEHRDQEDSGRVTQRRACGQNRRWRNNETNPSDKPHEHKRQRKEGESAKRVGVWLRWALCAYPRE